MGSLTADQEIVNGTTTDAPFAGATTAGATGVDASALGVPTSRPPTNTTVNAITDVARVTADLNTMTRLLPATRATHDRHRRFVAGDG